MKQHGKMTVLLLAAIWVLTAGSLPTAAQRVRPRLSDAMITTMVEHRLMDKMVLREDNVEVLVEDGAVTLTGTVRSLAERKRAEKEALGTDDVSSVRNELRIATEDRTDRQIAEDLGLYQYRHADRHPANRRPRHGSLVVQHVPGERATVSPPAGG